MTHQEIFDKSVTHMLTQGHQSSDGRVCKYRSDAGACAIGGLFPDSAYKKEFDTITDSSVIWLVQHFPAFAFALKSVGIDTSDAKTLKLLSALQNIHDSTSNDYFMNDIKNGAKYIAQDFDLTYNPESTS